MTNPGGTPSTPSRLLRNSTTKATDHELQKYDNFTRYGQAANAWAADDDANHESGSRSGRLGFVSFAC